MTARLDEMFRSTVNGLRCTEVSDPDWGIGMVVARGHVDLDAAMVAAREYVQRFEGLAADELPEMKPARHTWGRFLKHSQGCDPDDRWLGCGCNEYDWWWDECPTRIPGAARVTVVEVRS